MKVQAITSHGYNHCRGIYCAIKLNLIKKQICLNDKRCVFFCTIHSIMLCLCILVIWWVISISYVLPTADDLANKTVIYTNNYTYEYNYTLLFLLCVFYLNRISMKKWQCVCLAIVMLQWVWKHFPFLSGDPVQFKKRFHWTYANEVTNEHHRHYYYYYYSSAMFIWKHIWIMNFLYRTQVNVCIAISKGKRKLNSQFRVVIYPNRTCVH